MADDALAERIKALRETTSGLNQVSDDDLTTLLQKDPAHPEKGLVDNQTQDTRLKILTARLQAKATVTQAISAAIQGEYSAVQLKAAADCTPSPNYLKEVREARAAHAPIPAAPPCN